MRRRIHVTIEGKRHQFKQKNVRIIHDTPDGGAYVRVGEGPFGYVLPGCKGNLEKYPVAEADQFQDRGICQEIGAVCSPMRVTRIQTFDSLNL